MSESPALAKKSSNPTDLPTSPGGDERKGKKDDVVEEDAASEEEDGGSDEDDGDEDDGDDDEDDEDEDDDEEDEDDDEEDDDEDDHDDKSEKPAAEEVEIPSLLKKRSAPDADDSTKMDSPTADKQSKKRKKKDKSKKVKKR